MCALVDWKYRIPKAALLAISDSIRLFDCQRALLAIIRLELDAEAGLALLAPHTASGKVRGSIR